MAIERITNLSAPPVVGRWYLVPTVEYRWILDYEGPARPYPVFLPKHEDREHFDFPYPHYHVDPRFLTARVWRRVINDGKPIWGLPGCAADGFAACQRKPLHRLAGKAATVPHPPVVWRRMRCARSYIAYQFGDQAPVLALGDDLKGRQCKRARSGWICPHRNFPLGSVHSVNGVITCPLHGMRIRAADGVVIGDEA